MTGAVPRMGVSQVPRRWLLQLLVFYVTSLALTVLLLLLAVATGNAAVLIAAIALAGICFARWLVPIDTHVTYSFEVGAPVARTWDVFCGDEVTRSDPRVLRLVRDPETGTRVGERRTLHLVDEPAKQLTVAVDLPLVRRSWAQTPLVPTGWPRIRVWTWAEVEATAHGTATTLGVRFAASRGLTFRHHPARSRAHLQAWAERIASQAVADRPLEPVPRPLPARPVSLPPASSSGAAAVQARPRRSWRPRRLGPADGATEPERP